MFIHGINSSETINQNIKNRSRISNGSVFIPSGPEEAAPKKVKVGVFLTTLAGVSTAMAINLKQHKLSMNPFNKLGKSIKNWAIFNDKLYEGKELGWMVVKLAIGSVAGGLIGGAIFDKKENMKAKYRESIIQLVGNIATPLVCVCAGNHLFKKYANQKLIKLFNLQNKSERVRGIPGIIASAGFLTGAIFLGNKVGNEINKKLFNIDDNRKLKLTDMSPHIDDVCISLSLGAAENTGIGAVISKFIPAALLISGFSVGTIQEHPALLKAKNDNKSSNDKQNSNAA